MRIAALFLHIRLHHRTSSAGMAEPTAVQDTPLAKLDAAAAPSAPVPDDKAVQDKLEQLHDGSTKQQQQQPNEDSDSDGDADDGDLVNGASGAASGASKKKKKKKPKKKKGAAGAGGAVSGPAMQQTEPPSIGMSKLYPGGNYPVGEVSEYTGDNAYRTTSEEKRHLERIIMQEDPSESAFNYNSIRRAAEVHRQVRQYAQRTIKPGMKMLDIANMIEDGVRTLAEVDGSFTPLGPGHPKSGMGFPLGLSLNHCAAHYTPNAGDQRVLGESDVLKVDIGVQVSGRIVDSAFTMSMDHKYERLLDAVRDATNTGIREAGIDVRVGDLGAAIQEIMESYEVEANGKTHQVKSIRNLTGHTIHPWSIHGTKCVPIVKSSDQTKMEEGDYFAIETFGSTGRGEVHDEGECSHYALMKDTPRKNLTLASAKRLLNTIDREFGTLPFARRYVDRVGETNYLLGLRELVKEGIVQAYPPLCDVKGSMTAQYEHTILLRPTCKEVVSRGEDY